MKLKVRDAHNLLIGIQVVVNYDDNFHEPDVASGAPSPNQNIRSSGGRVRQISIENFYL